MPRRHVLFAAAVLLMTLVPQASFGHKERPSSSPPRPGSVPDVNRVHDLVIDVCKTGECAFADIQAAVDAVPAGKVTPTLIRVWPGLYDEEPSRAVGELPADNPDGTYSYNFQLTHPNVINLIAIVGKKNVTVRGMGASPHDVVIDAAFKKHVGLRGDRSDGLILQNFAFYHAFEHGVYVMETDGYVIDRVFSAYSQEYPFLTFADDHGLMINCEAIGGGDGGIYPGGSADTPGRYSQEISHCVSHHNVLGYSGTQGDHVWVHDSVFYDNAVGLVSDSETDHPNYPENNLILERNRFHDNNFNPYLPTADVGPVEFDESGGGFNGTVIPVGVGVFLASGNENLVQNNDIWGNDRYGVWLASGEGLVVGPSSTPMAPPFASSGNRFIGNRMYGPAGVASPKLNGTDFAWDGMGLDNCWQDNVRSAAGDAVTTDALVLPPCRLPVATAPLPVGVPNPANAIAQVGSSKYNGKPMCFYLHLQPCVFGPGPAPGKARNRPDGYQPPPAPAPCGPSTCAAAASAKHGPLVSPVTFHRGAPSDASTLPATGISGAPVALVVLLLAGSAAGVYALVRRR